MNDLDHRLRNWARWLRSWARQDHCRSLEGAYRSPQCWYPREPRPERPDEEDAWDIELAARCMALHYHLLLKLHYHTHSRPAAISGIVFRHTRHRMHAADIDAAIGMSQSLLLERLAWPRAMRQEQAQAWLRRELRK